MEIVHQKDKKSGITYAYESISHWDKEKKQSRAKCTLIGRLDTATGEITATDGRGRKHDVTSKQGPVPVAHTRNMKRHTKNILRQRQHLYSGFR